ncbi:hypothetical protein DFH27DRAFT_644547 [Peziza echinospora]|nr:hypothetical protein DFH27DRAFT_644547 [Peziza echinospora]
MPIWVVLSVVITYAEKQHGSLIQRNIAFLSINTYTFNLFIGLTATTDHIIMSDLTLKIACKQTGCEAIFNTKAEQKQHARIVHQVATHVTYLDNSQKVIMREEVVEEEEIGFGDGATEIQPTGAGGSTMWSLSEPRQSCVSVMPINIVICTRHRLGLGWDTMISHLEKKHQCNSAEAFSAWKFFEEFGWSSRNIVDDGVLKQSIFCLIWKSNKEHVAQISMQRFTPNHKYFEVQQSTQEVNQASQQILKRFDEEYIKGSNDSSLQFLHVDQEVESQWVQRTGWSQLFAGRDLKMLALNTHLGYLRGHGNGRLKKEQWHRLDDEFEDLWKQADYSWKSLPMTTIAKLREVRLTSDGSMQHAGKLPQLVQAESGRKYQRIWKSFLTYALVWNTSTHWFYDNWLEHTSNAQQRVLCKEAGREYAGGNDVPGNSSNCVFTWAGDLVGQIEEMPGVDFSACSLKFPFNPCQADMVRHNLDFQIRPSLDLLAQELANPGGNNGYEIRNLLLRIIISSTWADCHKVENPLLSCYLSFCGVDGKDGTLRDARTYTGTLAAITYGIRLFSVLWIQKECYPDGLGEIGTVLDYLKRTSLSSTGSTVFSQVQMLLGYGMAINKSTQSRHTITWTKMKDGLIFGGKLLHIERIQAAIRHALDNCWRILEMDILDGRRLNIGEWVESLANVVDDPGRRAPHFCFLEVKCGPEERSPFEDKFNLVLKGWLEGSRSSEVIEEREGSGSGRLNTDWSQRFLAWNQQDRLRNVIILEGQVLLFADYNKTDKKTGRNKVITRVLPDEVGLLLVIFLVMLEPVRRHALNSVAVACYRSMTGEGKRLETEKEEDIGDTVGELQAGHSHTVAVLNYAVISDNQLVRMVDEETLNVFRRACADWHNFLNLGADSNSRVHQAILAGQKKTNVKGKGVSKTSRSTNIGNQSTIQSFFSKKLEERAKEWSEAGVEQQAIMAHKLMFKKFPDEQERFKSHGQKRLVELMFLELGRNSWKGKPKLVIMPTGEGKSLLYLLPAFHPEARLTIVFCPYKALVNDQIMRVKAAGLKINEKVAFQDRIGSRPQTGVVVLSYDSLRKDFVLDWLRERADANHISKIVVDECHVVLSEWVLTIGEKQPEGFRPCMAKIALLSKLSCPLLFLTATMPPHWTKSWAQAHNTLKEDKERGWKRSIVWLRQFVEGEGRLKGNEHGLVFFGSKGLLEDAAVAVEELGLVIFRHHSDMTEIARKKSLKSWVDCGARWLFATKGIGAGVDFEVDRVVNVGLPDTMVEYAQQSGRGGRSSGSAVATLVFEGTLEPESLNGAPEEATVYGVDGDEMEGMDQAYMWRCFLRASKCRRELLGYFLDGMPRSCEGIPNGELCDCCKRRGAVVNRMEAGKARDARETLEEIFRAKAVLVKFERMEARTGVPEEVDMPEVELEVDGEFEEVGDGLEGGDSAEEDYREDLTQVMVEELGNRGVQCGRGQEEREDDSWIQDDWNSSLELPTVSQLQRGSYREGKWYGGNEPLDTTGKNSRALGRKFTLKERREEKGKGVERRETDEVIYISSESEDGIDEGEEGADEEEYGSEIGEEDWEKAMGGLERERGGNDCLGDIASSSILPTPAEQMLVYSEVNRWSEEAEDAEEEEEEREGCGVMMDRGADLTHSQLLDIFNTTMQSRREKGVGEGVLGMNSTDGSRKVRKAMVLSPINHFLSRGKGKRVRSESILSQAVVSSSALNRFMEETAASIPESRDVGREIEENAVEEMNTVGRRIERNEVQIRGTQEQERRRVKDLLLWIETNCVWCWGQDEEGWEGRCTWNCNRHEEVKARLKAAKHHLKLKAGKICFSCLLDQETCGKWMGKGKPTGIGNVLGQGGQQELCLRWRLWVGITLEESFRKVFGRWVVI